MREYAFPPASNRGDWCPSFAININGSPAVWDLADDIVTVAIAYPWEHAPDDYEFPRNRRSYASIQASSIDGSGAVALINPGLISICIGGGSLGQFGIAQVQVALKYSRQSDGRQATIFVGRLPLVEGIV